MEIKTNFALRQKVFFMRDNQVNEGTIASILISVYPPNKVKVTHVVDQSKEKTLHNMDQDDLFESKQSLLQSL